MWHANILMEQCLRHCLSLSGVTSVDAVWRRASSCVRLTCATLGQITRSMNSKVMNPITAMTAARTYE